MASNGNHWISSIMYVIVQRPRSRTFDQCAGVFAVYAVYVLKQTNVASIFHSISHKLKDQIFQPSARYTVPKTQLHFFIVPYLFFLQQFNFFYKLSCSVVCRWYLCKYHDSYRTRIDLSIYYIDSVRYNEISNLPYS